MQLIVVLLCLISGNAHAQQRGEPSARPLRNAALPPELKELKERGLDLQGDRVIFEGDLSFPPKLKGQSLESNVHLDIIPGRRLNVQETRQEMRAVAIAEPKVKRLLGQRFSLLSSGWLDKDKQGIETTAEDRYEMVFYNYVANHVVTVTTSKSGDVKDVRSKRVIVQPPESREEIEAAAKIVHADRRHGEATRDLLVRGIVTEGRAPNRYLYLLFYRESQKRAVYDATVDISSGRIVSAGPVR